MLTEAPLARAATLGFVAGLALDEALKLCAPGLSVARGLGLWSALVGAVSFEVFDQYGPDTLSDPAAFFDLHMEALVDGVGF